MWVLVVVLLQNLVWVCSSLPISTTSPGRIFPWATRECPGITLEPVSRLLVAQMSLDQSPSLTARAFAP